MNTIIVAPNPFEVYNEKLEIPQGLTISEMIGKQDFIRKQVGFHVWVNDRYLEKDKWDTTIPKEKDTVIFRAYPLGGGDGKNVLATVLTIGVMIAAPYLGGMAAQAAVGGYAAIGPSTAAFTLASKVFTAAISMVGMLAVNAIVKPPSTDLNSLSGNTSEESRTFSGSSNSVSPYGVVPRVYGRRKVIPILGAHSYTEIAGDDEYYNMLFCFGNGPLALSDFKIGDNPLGYYSDVDFEVREGWDDDEDLTLFKQSVRETQYSIKVTEAGGSQIITSGTDADELILDIGFNGLVSINETTGEYDDESVDLTVEYRKVGDTAWIDYNSKVISVNSSNMHFNGGYGYYYYGTGYTSNAFIYDITNTINFREAGFRSGNTVTISGFTESEYNGTFTIDYVTDRQIGFDQKIGPAYYYENSSATVTKVADPANITFTNNVTTTYEESVRIITPEQGQYEIQVTRITEDNTEQLILNDSYITALRTVTYTNPVVEDNMCLMALRIKATDQLSGSVDTFSAIAESYLPTWDGSTWTDPILTSNPAWIIIDILKSAGITDDKLDLDEFKDYADDCDTLDINGNPYWEYNSVFDYSTTVFEAANEVASTGRASLGYYDGKYTIIRDRLQTVPIQHFTPRNIISFSGDKIFVNQPHALKVNFISIEKGWEQDTVIVYDDGYDETNATIFEDLDLAGVTSHDQAYREGRYHIACGRLRPESFTITTDIENLVCTRGDLVYVTNDIPKVGGQYGRIKSIVTSGDDVVTVTLDDLVPISEGIDYVIRVRKATGASITSPVLTETAGEYTTIDVNFLGPDNVPEVGDLYMFGEIEAVPMLVSGITAGENLSAVLNLIPYSEDVYSADTGTIPEYNPNITVNAETVAPPAVINLTVTEDHVVESRRYINNLVLTWRLPDGYTSKLYEIYRYKNDKWVYLGSTTERRYTYEKAITGNKEKFAVIALAPSGAKLTLVDASKVTYTVQGVTPNDVTSFNFSVLNDEAFVSWSIDDTVADHWQIRYSNSTIGATWETMVVLQEKISFPTNKVKIPTFSGTYAIKAYTYEGVASENDIQAIVDGNTFSLQNINIVDTINEHDAWAGTADNVEVVEGVVRLIGGLFDDADGLFDDKAGLFDNAIGGTIEITSGTYTFYDTVDLSEVYLSRITASLTVSADNLSILFDSAEGLFDSREGLFDNADLSKTSVKIQIRTTSDDPSASPIWSEWQDFVIGDYTARGIQFRLYLSTTDINITPIVEEATVTIDMPDRTISGDDVVSSASGTTVSFTPNFKSSSPVVIINPNNALSGDYYEITNKSASGFDIQFYDSTNTGVSRTFDWIAKGYGSVIT